MPWTSELFNRVVRQNRLKVSLNDRVQTKTQEFATEQTDTVFIPAPGDGKRLVLTYLSLRTEAATGTMEFTGTYEGSDISLAKDYVTVQRSFIASAVFVNLDENTPLRVTTDVGSSNTFVAVQYIIEDVE